MGLEFFHAIRVCVDREHFVMRTVQVSSDDRFSASDSGIGLYGYSVHVNIFLL